MLSSLLLLLGNIGGTELLIIMGVLLALILAVIWRLVRPTKHAVIMQHSGAVNSFADELLKLEQLRDRGVLTAQEFEQQKQRLLRS